MIKNILQYLIISFLVISFSIVLVSLYWVIVPYNLFALNVSPMKVMTPNVKIGENLVYLSEYCKNTTLIPFKVTRQLVNGYSYDLPVSTSSSFPTGCGAVEVSVPLYLASSVKAGKYKIKVTIDYQANPLRVWTIEMYTQEFNIIK